MGVTWGSSRDDVHVSQVPGLSSPLPASLPGVPCPPPAPPAAGRMPACPPRRPGSLREACARAELVASPRDAAGSVAAAFRPASASPRPAEGRPRRLPHWWQRPWHGRPAGAGHGAVAAVGQGERPGEPGSGRRRGSSACSSGAGQPFLRWVPVPALLSLAPPQLPGPGPSGWRSRAGVWK